MTCTNTVPCKKFYERLSGRDFPLSFSFLLLLPSVDIQLTLTKVYVWDHESQANTRDPNLP